MLFYFITYFSIGLLSANTANLYFKSRQAPSLFPLWFQGPAFTAFNAFGILAFFLSPLLTFTNWGIGWTLVSLAELIAGALAVGFLPLSYRFGLTVTGPLTIFLFLGALLKFWFLSGTLLLVVVIFAFISPIFLLTRSTSANSQPNIRFSTSNVPLSASPPMSSKNDKVRKTTNENSFLDNLEMEKISKKGKKPSEDIFEKAKEILEKNFQHPLQDEAKYVLMNTCYEAEKLLGNEFDAAIKFMFIRLNSLSINPSEKKKDFILTQSKFLIALRDKSILSQENVLITVNSILKKHGLSN